MNESPPMRVLWEWNVKAHGLAEQVEAAAAGGFDVLTVPYRKYREALASGLTTPDVLALAKDHSVRLDFLDGFSGWAPIRYPDGADAFLVAALDYSAEDALRTCDELGLTRIAAIAGFPPDALELPALVDAFGGFCERAAAAGIWVALEAMPMLGIPTLAQAWEIVRGAGAPNSGLLLDTWHFVRSDPDLELLRGIPPGKLVDLQLVDGFVEPTSEDLWVDVMKARLLPGEGELPLAEILAALGEHHVLQTVGPEAITDELDTLAPAALGHRAADTTNRVLAAAGIV